MKTHAKVTETVCPAGRGRCLLVAQRIRRCKKTSQRISIGLVLLYKIVTVLLTQTAPRGVVRMRMRMRTATPCHRVCVSSSGVLVHRWRVSTSCRGRVASSRLAVERGGGVARMSVFFAQSSRQTRAERLMSLSIRPG